MPYEYTPPKYAQVIAELQRRIESGEYPPGSLIPSEHQLVGRVRDGPADRGPCAAGAAAGRLDRDPAGQGQFRPRPSRARRGGSEPGGVRAELDRDEAREGGELVSVGLAAPPPRIAALLGWPKDRELVCRRRLVRQDGEPSEVVTWWFPPELAEGTDLAGSDPLRGGIRAYLARRKGVRVDHVVEQVTARHPERA